MTSQAWSAGGGGGDDSARFEASGLVWFAAAADAALLRREVAERLDALEALPGSALLKRNLVRAVLRVPLSDGRRVIVKRYRVAGAADALKYLVRASRARTEWRVGRALERAGIATSIPLAFAERRGGPWLRDAALVAREIESSERFDTRLAQLRGAERDALLGELARLVRRLHDAGFAHRDLHAGNLLVAGEPARIHVIDLHSMRRPLRRLTQRARWQDLVKLCHSLRGFATPEERVQLVERYARAAPGDTQVARLLADGRLAARLDAAVASLERVRVKSRTKRCLVRSTKFDVSRVAGCRVHHLRSVAAADAVALAGAEAGRLGARAARVVRVPDAWWRPLLGLRPRALDAWVTANGLRVRGADTAEPLAVVLPGRRAAFRDAYLVVEDRGA